MLLSSSGTFLHAMDTSCNGTVSPILEACGNEHEKQFYEGDNNKNSNDGVKIIMIEVEDLKHQSSHSSVNNLAVASSCPVSVPKLLCGTQSLAC